MLRFIMQNSTLKKFINPVLLMAITIDCAGQNKPAFEQFTQKFSKLDLPIDSVQLLHSNDTMDVKLFNYILWENQQEEDENGKVITIRPKVYKEGKLVELTSFGKANEIPMIFRMSDGKSGKFFSKVYPIGRINLNDNYLSFIVKEFSSEISHFDLYNFTKDGKRLSAVPLFTYICKLPRK